MNILWKALLAASMVGSILAAALAVVLPGSREDAALSLRWVAPGAEGGGTGDAPIETLIYISNPTGEPLRDASLRFYPATVLAPPGVSLGTVANVSSHFEGPAQVWPLGDIEAGTRVVFHLGLWFDAGGALSRPDGVELTIQLVSPDLAEPLTSNELQVLLNP